MDASTVRRNPRSLHSWWITGGKNLIRPEVIQVDKDKIQKEGDKSYIKKKEEKREKRVSKFLKKKKTFLTRSIRLK